MLNVSTISLPLYTQTPVAFYFLGIDRAEIDDSYSSVMSSDEDIICAVCAAPATERYAHCGIATRSTGETDIRARAVRTRWPRGNEALDGNQVHISRRGFCWWLRTPARRQCTWRTANIRLAVSSVRWPLPGRPSTVSCRPSDACYSATVTVTRPVQAGHAALLVLRGSVGHEDRCSRRPRRSTMAQHQTRVRTTIRVLATVPIGRGHLHADVVVHARPAQTPESHQVFRAHVPEVRWSRHALRVGDVWPVCLFIYVFYRTTSFNGKMWKEMLT